METRVRLEETGRRILNASRAELYLSMRFMGQALGSLDYTMDLSTTTVGTDAVSIRYNPTYLLQLYLKEPRHLNRTYLHILLHCLFRHMFTSAQMKEKELWDLCCDIAVEALIDSMDYPAISRTLSDFRAGFYRQMEEEIGVLTAEKLYRYYLDRKRDYMREDVLQREFFMDDHSFWQRMEDEENKDPDSPEAPPSRDSQDPEGRQKEGAPQKHLKKVHPREEDWKKNADRVRAELDVIGKEASRESGELERILKLTARKRTSYKEFLRRFAVIREETSVDPDSFDYGFYNYGMEVYGNMPLIEENEYREARRIEDLVIAIDTSASCQETLVQRFLNETAGLLQSQETFFHRVNIHILECDERVHADVLIRDVKDMERYTDSFTVSGGFGTDFRPVFAYVERLQKAGQLKGLRGLMYFTDGFGTYPEKPTPYDTAFVFWDGEENGADQVPGWAMKLFLDDTN